MTATRPPTVPLVFGLVAGVGFVSLAVGAVVLLSMRSPPPVTVATVPLVRDDPIIPPVAKPETAPAPRTPRPAPLPPPPTGRLQPETAVVKPSRYNVGAAVEQEVLFTRAAVYRIQGVEFTQAAEYAFVSDLVVDTLRTDGGCTMKQTIRSTRLTRCDPAQRKELQAALDKTRGTKFVMTVGPDGELKEFQGPKDVVQVQAANDLVKAASIRVWSLLDPDAWKELAAVTLLQPPNGAGPWNRPIAHDWGLLGKWDGRTAYRFNGKQAGQDRIDYTHGIVYHPPAAGAGDDLPLRIVRAELRSPSAAGSILFDPAAGRVTRAEETFRVQGRVVASALGAEITVDLDERQDFQVTIREPTERSLKGQPKR